MDRLIEQTEFKTTPKWEYNKFWLEDGWIFWEGAMQGASHSNVMRGLDVGNSTDAVWGYYRQEEDELEALCELDHDENPPKMQEVLETFPNSTVTWNGEVIQWEGSQDPQYLQGSKEAMDSEEEQYLMDLTSRSVVIDPDLMIPREHFDKFVLDKDHSYFTKLKDGDEPSHRALALYAMKNYGLDESTLVTGYEGSWIDEREGGWEGNRPHSIGIGMGREVSDEILYQYLSRHFPDRCQIASIDGMSIDSPFTVGDLVDNDNDWFSGEAYTTPKEAATPPFNRTVLYDLVKFIGLNGTTVDYGDFYESTSASEEEARSVLEILTEAGAMDKVEEYTFEVDPVKFKELLSAIDEEEQIDTDPLLELFEFGVNKPRMPEGKVAIDSVDPSGEEWDGAIVYPSPDGLGEDLKFIITDTEDMFWKFPRENSGEPEHITIANTFDVSDGDDPMFGYYASLRPVHLEKVEVWGDQQEPDENKVAKLLGYFGDKVIRWNGKRLFIREDGSYFWDKLAKISMISEDRMYSSPVPDKPNKFLILDDEVYFWELTDTSGTDFFVRPTHSDAAYTISKYYENPEIFLAGAINLSEEIMEFSGLLVPPQSMALNDMEDPDEGILEYMPEQIQDVIPNDVKLMSQRELNDYSNQYAMMFESKLAQDQDFSDSIMVALAPPENIRKEIAIEGGEEEDNLHVTLAYVPDFLSRFSPEILEEIVNAWYEDIDNPTGSISGYGTFQNDENHVLWAAVDLPCIDDMRHDLAEAIEEAFDVDLDEKHGFSPHMTISYLDTMSDESVTLPQLPESVQDDFEWIPIIAVGGEWIELPTDGSGENKTADLDWENLYQQIESPFIDDQTGEISFYTDELMQSGGKGWVEPDGTYYVWDAMSSDRFYGVVGDHHGQAMLAKEFNGKNWQDLSQDMKEEFYGSGAGFRDAWIKLYNVSILECSPSGDEFVVVGKDATQEQKESIAYLLDRLNSNPTFISIELGRDVADFDNKEDAGEWLVTGELPEGYGEDEYDDFDTYSSLKTSEVVDSFSLRNGTEVEVYDGNPEPNSTFVFYRDRMLWWPLVSEYDVFSVRDYLISRNLRVDSLLMKGQIIYGKNIDGDITRVTSDVKPELPTKEEVEWILDVYPNTQELQWNGKDIDLEQHKQGLSPFLFVIAPDGQIATKEYGTSGKNLHADLAQQLGANLNENEEDENGNGYVRGVVQKGIFMAVPGIIAPFTSEQFQGIGSILSQIDMYHITDILIEDSNGDYEPEDFGVYKQSSILSPIHPQIAEDIWDIDLMTIEPELKEFIWQKIDDALSSYGLYDEHLKRLYIIGSITGRQYDFDSDVDVNLYIDIDEWAFDLGEDPEDLRNSVRKSLVNQNGDLPPDSTHPVNFFLSSTLEDPPADGIYDVLDDMWVKHPDDDYPEDFNPYEDFKEAFDRAEELAERVDGMWGKAMRANEAYLLYGDDSFKDRYISYLNELAETYETLAQERRDVFDIGNRNNIDVKALQRSNANIIYKFLEKWGIRDKMVSAKEALKQIENGISELILQTFAEKNPYYRKKDEEDDDDDGNNGYHPASEDGRRGDISSSLSKEGEEGEIVGYDENDIWIREMDWATYVDIDDENIEEFHVDDYPDMDNRMEVAIGYAEEIWDGSGRIMFAPDESNDFEDITPEVTST